LTSVLLIRDLSYGESAKETQRDDKLSEALLQNPLFFATAQNHPQNIDLSRKIISRIEK
jgi:hypothetical protein